MTLPAPSIEERQALLKQALSPLGAQEATELFPWLDDLFASILTEDELLHDGVENPIEHHTTVLKHMIEIAQGEGFDWSELRRAAAIALLHDNWPARKITREMRAAARTDEEKARLKALNLLYRTEHMNRGSENARRRLHELNRGRMPPVFSAEDIDAICGVIAIHDDPSIDRPLPNENRMAIAFREADRLWMQAPEGVRADLARQGNHSPTPHECKEQASRNLRSYREERALYPDGEAFLDHETGTLFRTATGYRIFLRYRRHWNEPA